MEEWLKDFRGYNVSDCYNYYPLVLLHTCGWDTTMKIDEGLISMIERAQIHNQECKH